MDYAIHTFGNGEILKGVFDALASCLNSQSGSLYVPLVRITLIIGGLWAALYAIYGDYMRAITHWIIPMTVIMQLLFVPQATVWIIDPLTKPARKVDRVPYGLAMLAGTISKIGFHLTEQVEKIFVLPDDLKYQKSGALFASHLLQQAKNFRITNEELAQNMHQFVGQCVAYDMLLGRKYTLEDLRHSDNIWELVSTNASPVRSFLWRDLRQGTEPRPRPKIITCADGIVLFNQQWEPEKKRAATLFGKKLFGKNSLLNPHDELLRYLPIAYSTLTNMSQGAQDILQQQMMIYAVVDGIEQKSTSLGNAPNFAVRRAYLQQRATYETLGAMAAETLPTMKVVLEAIAYASFLFVIPLALLPFGYRFLSSWLQTLLWLQMWAPLYAVLNYIMTMAARTKSLAALSLSNEAGITIANSVGLVNVNADIAAMAGYLAISIPFLCIALVKGVGTFVQMASHLSQVTQSAAGQAAGDALTGNYSFGNISSGNRQIANTSMLSHSHAASYQSGSFHQADGQTDILTTADGQQIMNIRTSNLPITLNVAETLSAQKTEQSGKSYQNALIKSASYVKSMAKALRQSVDLSNHLGKTAHSSKQTSSGTSIDHSQGINKMGQIVKDFAKNNNLSVHRASQILASVAVKGPEVVKAVGAEAGASINLGGSGDKTTIYSKAQKTVESKDFQEALRLSEQDIQNKSFGRTDDESKKIVENIHQSWEEANSSREEATKSFRESEDYLKQAAYLQNSAASINTNYNHQFKNWLAKQPADNVPGGPLRQKGVANMIANDPKLAMLYAQRFLEEEGLLPQKPSEIADNPEVRAQETYKHESRHVIVPVDKDDALQKMQALKDKGKAQGLGPVTDDQGLENRFSAKEAAMKEKIAAQQKEIEQEHADKAYKHHRESRKSLVVQAVKQEFRHVVDVGTHIVDLVRGDTQGEKK